MRKTLFVALSSAVLSLVAYSGAQAQSDAPGTIVEVSIAGVGVLRNTFAPDSTKTEVAR